MIDMSDLNIETKHDALEMGSLKDSETSIGVSQVSALSKVWKEILNIDDVTKQKNVRNASETNGVWCGGWYVGMLDW
jgi:hypothetical protein